MRNRYYPFIRKTVGIVALVSAAALATIGTSALARAGLRLIVGGKTASTDLRILDGQPFVPLADMAKAMNGSVLKRQDGRYEITLNPKTAGGGPAKAGVATGGANEVRGTKGKIGEVLFNGKWRFSVLSVAHAASYESQFLPEKRTFAPNGDSEELVIVRCRMKNGQKDSKAAMLSPIHPHHTGLADNQGQSYPPLDYDKRGGHTDEGPTMLPGAQTEFAIVFSVPKGAVLKDLVFSVQNADNDDLPDGGTDTRITLAQ